MTRPVFLAQHAQRAMHARNVSLQEILDIVENYQNRWSVSQHRGVPTPDRFVYQGQDLALVVVEKPHKISVLTVLLKEQAQWSDSDARNRPSAATADTG